MAHLGVATAAAAAASCAAPGLGTGKPRVETAPGSTVSASTVLPARYDEGRWVMRPVTAAGDTLDLHTDSGGVLFIARERLGPGAALAFLAFAERGPTGDPLFTVAAADGGLPPSARVAHDGRAGV